MSDRPDQSIIPEWLSDLDALLVLDQKLDQLARDRDPEKTNAPSMHHRVLVYGLSDQFAKYQCLGYWAWLGRRGASVLPPGAKRPPTNPAPEEEMAALHAVIAWLKPAPDYPPFTMHEEQQELFELRRRVTRAAEDRLAALSGAGGKPDAGTVGAKRGTVNQRMLEQLHREPESAYWTQRAWAKFLHCRPSAVAKAPAWKTAKAARALAVVDRLDRPGK